MTKDSYTYEELTGFKEWFKKFFLDKPLPFKDGMKRFDELPANMKAMTFTQALKDFVEEKNAGKR